MSHVIDHATDHVTDHIADLAALKARFTPLLNHIAQGSIERENERALPHEAVQALKESGFTALRVPVEFGGSGVTLRQYFNLLIHLSEADSNLAQILRVNSGFVEQLLEREQDDKKGEWLSQLGRGKTVGAATSERTGATANSVIATPDEQEGYLRLNGEKYYSTGTLYADWIIVRAHDQASDLDILVDSDTPGVERRDDWDGFGQRLTASGTTLFNNVQVSDVRVIHRYQTSQPRRDSLMTAFYQTNHLATLAGIAKAVLRDANEFVQGRTRTFGVPGQSSPRNSPLVQGVIGRLASLAWSTEHLVDAIAAGLDRISLAREAGTVTEEDYIALDIEVFQAQQIIAEQVLEATTLLFEVGGSSATSDKRRLDRHWRNARTLASHNPSILRQAAIGDFYLNDTPPSERFGLAYSA